MTTTTVGALEALAGGCWVWMDGAVDGAGLWMHASGRVASVQWVDDRLVATWSV